MHENANPIIREPPGTMLLQARKALMFKDLQYPLTQYYSMHSVLIRAGLGFPIESYGIKIRR